MALLATIAMREPKMPSVYEAWMGQPVVLQVAAGEIQVPLHGIIVSENHDALKFRVGEGWDIDIFKDMILAVEEDHWASIVTH
jgi:hypothetical protein